MDPNKDFKKIPARGWTFELNTGTPGAPDWVAVGGLNSWSARSTKTDTDTTTFEDQGAESHMPIRRGASFTLEGLYKADPETGDREQGQAALEVVGQAVGPAGIKQFRIISPEGTTKTFDASFNVTIGGGGDADGTAWSVEITVDGAITGGTLTLPAAPTDVAGTEGDESSLITWTDPATGSPFLMFEAVVFDDADAEVARVQSNTQPVYVGGLTNDEDYTAVVRAKNASGWGPYSATSAVFTPTA